MESRGVFLLVLHNSATNTQPALVTMQILHHQVSQSFDKCLNSIILIFFTEIHLLSGSTAFESLLANSCDARRCKFHDATTVGVIAVENAFRVHLLVSRSTRLDDDPPDKSTSGFTVALVVDIAGSINMSLILSPLDPSTGIDHIHFAFISLMQQRRRRLPVCFVGEIDHNLTVPYLPPVSICVPSFRPLDEIVSSTLSGECTNLMDTIPSERCCCVPICPL